MTNTQDKVTSLKRMYYLCLQGVWFMAPTPTGQWTTYVGSTGDLYDLSSSRFIT
jgi:hypothetical protein